MKYFIFKRWLKDTILSFPQENENSEVLEIALFTYSYFSTQVPCLLRPAIFEYACRRGYIPSKRYRFVKDIMRFIEKEN